MNRGVVIAIAGAAGALVVAGAVAAWVLTRPQSPEAVADEYLKALSDGDFATIEGLLAERDDDLEPIESAFDGATGYISDYSFELNDDSDVTRTARADVELGGEPAVVGFVLVLEDGRWTVGEDYLASLEVEPTLGDSVRVGGLLVPASTTVPLLPAVYPIAAAPAGLLVGESTATVTNQAPVAVALDVTLAPGATEQAQEQLNSYSDACAEPATEVPPDCGLRVPWAADLATLTSISFRIEAYPVVTISSDASTFDAVDGRIVATATGSTRDGRPGTFTYQADDWALRGAVRFAGDEMVLEVR